MKRTVFVTLVCVAALNGCHSDPAAPREPFTVSGKVTLCRTGCPINDVVLTLTSPDTTLTTFTDHSGEYSFKSVPGGEYALSAARDSDSRDDSAILGTDTYPVWAAIETGPTHLTPCEFEAADVDRDGAITFDDAMAIEYFISEERDPSIVASTGHWVFSDPISAISSEAVVDFTGMLLGDVDGSWPNANHGSCSGSVLP